MILPMKLFIFLFLGFDIELSLPGAEDFMKSMQQQEKVKVSVHLFRNLEQFSLLQIIHYTLYIH